MAQPQRPYRAPTRVPPRRPAGSAGRAYSVAPRRSGGCVLLFGIVLAVLVAGGVYMGTRVFGALNNISSGEEVRPQVVAEGPPPALLQSPFNVLVIGVDLRANQPDEGARSDTLIVVHVDPVGKWASMLSIPRDTFVELPNAACANYQGTKINAAYSCGYRNPEDIFGPNIKPEDAGAALAAQTVEKFLGIEVNYTAQVDFNGFQKIVDTLGGVTVDVPRAILDPEYPTEDNGYMRLYIPPGLQRMNGSDALRYARTRHADNDFGRAQRQQQVLQAVLDELKRQGLLGQIEAAPRLLSVASEYVRTTLKVNDIGTIRGLADLAQELSPDRIQRLVLKPETNPDGSSNLLSDLSSAIQWDPAYIQRVVQQFELPPGEQAPTPAVVQVQNGTLKRGLAREVTTDLDVRGYKTATPVDAPEKGIPHTLILSYTGKKDAVQRLAQFFKVDPENIQDVSQESAPPDVDIVVRLGDDYQPPTDSTSNTR